MCLAPSAVALNDPHLPVLTCLYIPSPFVCGLDVVPYFYQTENRKSDRLSLPRLGIKDYVSGLPLWFMS